MSRCLRKAWALALLGWMVSLPPQPAAAGARDVEVLIVRLGTDQSPEAAACYAAFRAGLARSNGGEVHLVSIPRDVLLRRIDATDSSGFVSWPRERFAGVLNTPGAAALDAVVLVDCQPTTSQLDLVVFAGTGSLSSVTAQRLSLRHTPIDRAAARFAGTLAAAWQMRGFSP